MRPASPIDWFPSDITPRPDATDPVFVLEGSIWCGDRLCPAGTHIELPHGAAFGPFRAGPNGVTMFEVMLGDPRSWGDQPEQVDALRAEHGVTELPDPAIDLPGWLQDLRTAWTPDGNMPE